MKLSKRFIPFLIIFIIATSFILYVVLNKKEIPKTIKTIPHSDLDIVYGSDSASISIVMFSDYNCNYCTKFLINVFPLIESKYINTGKVKFIIKLISFSSNPYLIKSYKTVVCLNKYGNFDELNKLLLLEGQTIYTEQFNNLVEGYIERNTFFAECMVNGVAEGYLNDNMKQFIKYGFTGTPTFVINNKVYSGFIGYKHFSKIINKEL